MKHLLNTLFVTSEDIYLSLDGENVVANRDKQEAAIADQRRSQVGSGDRSERIRTYNFPQNRVTDLRLTGETKNFNIDAVINGALDPLIDALVLEDQAEKLRSGAEE